MHNRCQLLATSTHPAHLTCERIQRWAYVSGAQLTFIVPFITLLHVPLKHTICPSMCYQAILTLLPRHTKLQQLYNQSIRFVNFSIHWYFKMRSCPKPVLYQTVMPIVKLTSVPVGFQPASVERKNLQRRRSINSPFIEVKCSLPYFQQPASESYSRRTVSISWNTQPINKNHSNIIPTSKPLYAH
jgi:hypothetical protein